MPLIFNYCDYQTYLADWFEEKKAKSKTFSYASFAKQAGFSDRGYFHNVIHGKRDLTKASLVKVAQAIGLSDAEADYFENLVFFNKATSLKEKKFFFEKMNRVKTGSRAAADARRIREEQFEFYSEWHHSAVRSLIDMYPENSNNFMWLSRNVYPAITVRQVKKSVELLLHLDLIEEGEDGRYHLTSKSITTGREVTSLAVQHFHKSCADLAKRAIDVLPKSKRNVSGLTMGISEATYRRVCGELESFKIKIIEYVEADAGADRTYQLSLHLFPITKTDIAPREDI